MAIDFTLAPEHEKIRDRVRAFIQGTVVPAVEEVPESDREAYLRTIFRLREKAKDEGLWLPHMPEEWGGMGLGHVELAMVQAEAAKTRLGPVGAQLPGARRGQHAHAAALGRRRAEGEVPPPAVRRARAMSCFAMTEPEVAGSDPTLIQTHAVKDGDEWVINGHKWFISSARRAQLRHPHRPHRGRLPRSPQARQHRLPRRPARAEAGTSSATSRRCTARQGHCEIVITDLRVPDGQLLGGRGSGHRSASTASARPGWRTACAGSPRPRPRST